MLSIQLYLCELEDQSAVKTSVLRSVDDLRGRATAVAGRGTSVLIHVGASRPSDGEIRGLLSAWNACVLLTESARWSLNGPAVDNLAQIGQIEIRGCPGRAPVYIALSGWGYTREAPETEVAEEEAAAATSQATRLAKYPGLRSDDHFWKSLQQADADSRSHLLRERDAVIRQALRGASTQAIAVAAPEWLSRVPISRLPFRVRTKNCLDSVASAAPVTIADFAEWPDERLMKIRAFGRTSLADLRTTILNALLAGPVGEPSTEEMRFGTTQPLGARWDVCRAAIDLQSATTRIDDLDLGTRPRRILQSIGIQTVKELVELHEDDLLSLDTFGRQSLRDVIGALEVLAGQARSQPECEAQNSEDSTDQLRTTPSTLHAHLASTLEKLPGNHRLVIEGRLGAAGQPQTLGAIGKEIGLSKERVRQIERNQLRSIVDDELWDDELRERLHRLLDARTSPLSLILLPALDPWFEGFEDNADFLSGVIHAFGEAEFSCWDLDGVGRVVTRTTYEQWTKMQERLVDLIEHAHAGDLYVGDIREYAEMVAKSSGALDLSAALGEWVLCDAVLDGSQDNSQTRVLSRTTSAVDLCMSVLHDSDQPLHYHEIKKRIEDDIGHAIEVRRVHAALSREFLLYGRGTFGLLKHLSIGNVEASQLIVEVREILRAGSPGRQWHSQELLETLRETGILVGDSLTPYELSIVLREQEGIEYLGRQVWMLAEDDAASSGRRMIADLVEEAIRSAGGPLTGDEIWSAVSKTRGISRYRLVPETHRVVRVSRGRFGLIDRDAGLSHDDLQLWGEALQSAMSRDSEVAFADIKAIQRSMRSSALRMADSELLARVGAKIHGWRLTRDNELVRPPIGLCPSD
ncbi:MAG: DNA-directed RNA polymerase subunit alpha C-terminal domain-containing protein [Planctomycetota bacterium]